MNPEDSYLPDMTHAEVSEGLTLLSQAGITTHLWRRLIDDEEFRKSACDNIVGLNVQLVGQRIVAKIKTPISCYELYLQILSYGYNVAISQEDFKLLFEEESPQLNLTQVEQDAEWFIVPLTNMSEDEACAELTRRELVPANIKDALHYTIHAASRVKQEVRVLGSNMILHGELCFLGITCWIDTPTVALIPHNPEGVRHYLAKRKPAAIDPVVEEE